MKKRKTRGARSQRGQTKAVARRQKPALTAEAEPGVNSVDAIVRLLTPENRELLALIRDHKPRSVAELVELSGRSQPNLTRTLAKLALARFIDMKENGRRKAPSARIRKIIVHIDPYSENDVLEIA